MWLVSTIQHYAESVIAKEIRDADNSGQTDGMGDLEAIGFALQAADISGEDLLLSSMGPAGTIMAMSSDSDTPLSDAWDGVTDWGEEVWDEILAKLDDVAVWIDDAVSNLYDSLSSYISDIYTSITDYISEAVDWMWTGILDFWTDTVVPMLKSFANETYNFIIHIMGTILFGLYTVVDKLFRKHYGTDDVPRTPMLNPTRVSPGVMSYEQPTMKLDMERITLRVNPELKMFRAAVRPNQGIFSTSLDNLWLLDPHTQYTLQGDELIRVGSKWHSRIYDEWVSQNTQSMGQGGQGNPPYMQPELDISPVMRSENGIDVKYTLPDWDYRSTSAADYVLFETPSGDQDWWLTSSVFF